jgi:hypothetical protein
VAICHFTATLAKQAPFRRLDAFIGEADKAPLPKRISSRMQRCLRFILTIVLAVGALGLLASWHLRKSVPEFAAHDGDQDLSTDAGAGVGFPGAFPTNFSAPPAGSVAAPPFDQPAADAANSAATNSQAPATQSHRHLKRFFRAQLKPSLKDIAQDFQAGRSARISVPLFDGQEAVVVVDNFTPYGKEAGAFSGKVEGDPGSFVSVSYYEDAESGSIQFPAQNLVYTIQPEPDGSVLIGEVDVAALGTCGTCRGSVPRPGP